MLRVPPSPWIRAEQVPAGFDVADDRIAQAAQAGDVVVTADIPLAALVIEKQACVLDPRGDLIDHHSIQARLTMRNFMQSLREDGIDIDDYLTAEIQVYSQEGYPEGADLIAALEFTPTLLSISPSSGSSAGSWVKATGTGFGL